ncbi:helix-turn-helix domain-containing protein [Acidiphilium sp. PA]|uniref:helix-turn-helix transcriptional regulator n=1 Tax=Acidiphilium sp. PA TaxID=2871705 RepID=UPI002243C59C|nr:helix-turn-helix domain-containing protein [Acidiphilium sp. PA]MCW8308399.1 helix-turn-helix domain-containing protein [Acidiphilium sp. PA]
MTNDPIAQLADRVLAEIVSRAARPTDAPATKPAAAEPAMRENFDGAGAAAYLGVCKRTLERLDAAGDGPARVWITPRRYIYRKADLDGWLAARMKQPLAA